MPLSRHARPIPQQQGPSSTRYGILDAGNARPHRECAERETQVTGPPGRLRTDHWEAGPRPHAAPLVSLVAPDQSTDLLLNRRGKRKQALVAVCIALAKNQPASAQHRPGNEIEMRDPANKRFPFSQRGNPFPLYGQAVTQKRNRPPRNGTRAPVNGRPILVSSNLVPDNDRAFPFNDISRSGVSLLLAPTTRVAAPISLLVLGREIVRKLLFLQENERIE